MDNLIAPLEQELRGESITAYTMPDGGEIALKRASHKKIWWACPKGHTWQARVYTVTGGCGCPYCAGFTPLPGETDLATTHPLLAAEWSARNTLTPEEVSRGSQKRVWWRCPEGHEYEAAVYARVAGSGCPYCAGKKPIPGETDLATTHPALCAEWDAEKNSITPRDVTAGSHKAIWWRCALGHSWQAAPYSRVNGAGCPYCTNRKVLPGFNDLATTHPALCREWDEERNGDLSPSQLSFGSNRRVWWRCGSGHVWRAAVFSRTREKPTGCPVCERRAGLLSVGKHRRIWSLPFQFGDWCAPDEDFMRWVLKGKWVATAYFANSCRIVSRIAAILGESGDSAYYKKLYEEISEAYCLFLCDKSGKLKKEFQTAYVLPLAFKMAHGRQERTMASRLKELVEAADWSPRTGFPGTPYLLFALADHGEKDAALRTLMSESCPGWLYAVKAGATTIWERWDALRPDGSVNLGEHGKDDGGMVSFNHYANGAVGDFLYRRIAGLEATSGGYRIFQVAPMPGGGLTRAEVSVESPYGLIRAAWKIEDGAFRQEVRVPVSTECTVILPSGKTHVLQSGTYTLTESYKEV